MDDPTFWRPVDGGKVHVLGAVVRSPMADDLEVRGVTGFATDLLGALHAHWIARCGYRRPYDHMRGTVFEFADGDLCWACWTATPAHERDGLFEHPLPEAVYAREER